MPRIKEVAILFYFLRVGKMNKEEFRKRQKAVVEEMKKSSIPAMFRLLQLMLDACYLVANENDRRIRGYYKAFGFDVKGNDLIKGINEYCKVQKQAARLYFDKLANVSLDLCTDEGRVDNFDAWRTEVNQMVRLLMMFDDRICDNAEAVKKLNEVFEQYEDKDYTDEDYKRFFLK